ncbi:type II toxin-antitoxin system Phd/YefM family antitoxin [Cytobacillus depressus]|uniref:Type II toxin-antitoxin system Phd/YefM family antitoxin n=1 Tax=Cytobacillus depressus TaxID=1602942 RepID=A0A6L3V3D1_9BACI|nr:type II toxin-antitoxin system Phd/YefM family antitoxin [Cytobacillus depressus]KAB2328003.1 type II toxin-antitoxin system Phd/YefM family antitoxin [Cytobacillus depressus]
MAVDVMDKPRFNVDQVIPASVASRRFGEVRKNAKTLPQFISENNRIDSVILDYHQYEKMYRELEMLRELSWEMSIAQRLKQADANPNHRHSLQEVMGEEEFEDFRKIDPNSISDEDLFE